MNNRWFRRAAVAAPLAALLASCSTAYVPPRTPDLAAVPDGTYRGAYFMFPVSVGVDVKVAGGRIAAIDLLRHFNGQGKPAEALLPLVVERQSVELDAVAGATHSSKVILKAVEDALGKAAR